MHETFEKEIKQVHDDLNHWRNAWVQAIEKEHEEGIRVAKLMLDKYLDALIKLRKND